MAKKYLDSLEKNIEQTQKMKYQQIQKLSGRWIVALISFLSSRIPDKATFDKS